MIRNNYHSTHLNMAMSLNTAFVLEQVAARAVEAAAVAFAVFVAADIRRIAASYHLQDNNLYMDILAVHSNNTFILSPFSLNIFKGENECDILYICTSGSLTCFFLFFKRNLRFFSYK